jgi:hypothetical protein
MDNRTKAEILVQFTQDEFNSGEYEEFFDYNDLGIPLSIAITQDMVILTDSGEQLLEETWKELCLLFEADPNGEYESIDDLTVK